MANTTKWFYRIEREQGGGRDVQHIAIEVFPSNGRSFSDGLFTFEWQTHKEDGGFRSWYGFHIEVGNCGSLAELEEATRLARRLLRDEERPHREWSPREIVAQLEARLKARRAVYDRRVSGFVPVEELAPQEVSCWIDDYRAMGQECCQVGVLAVRQEEAQDRMLAEALRLGYEQWLAQFIQAGKPVMIRDQGGPDVEELESLLHVEADDL